MTHAPQSPQPSDAPPSPVSRAYAAPSLTPLGSVDAVTAGPDGGALDQLVGSSGGFQPDTTS